MKRTLSTTAAVLAFAIASPARAAVCGADAPGTPIVYLTGTAKTYVAALARALHVDTQPLTLVFVGASSCNAWDAILNGTPLTGKGSTWDTAGNEITCDLPTDGGPIIAGLGVADIFASSCEQLSNGLPKNVGDFFGPVQSMTFVVPKASSQRAISATAAYFVYGFGSESGVPPWTNDASIFRLDDASGTERIIAAGIGLPPQKWKGTNLSYTGMEVAKLTSVTAADAESTIGILAYTNITDALAPSIRVLAYKHYHESCAYFPDSTDSSKDKANVRDGHYALWGPIHVATKLGANGYPVDANAGRVVNYLTGTTKPPGGLDLIEVAAVNNLVPTCAMRVTRSSEMGPLASYAPQNACGCYFDRIATGSTDCKPCSTSSDCPTNAPVCSFGYCETQ